MATINWKVSHYLRDGTELKPGMQFPDNPENRATIERVRAICRKALEGGEHNDKA